MGHDRHARVRTFAVGVVRDQNKDERYGFRSRFHQFMHEPKTPAITKSGIIWCPYLVVCDLDRLFREYWMHYQ
jgi:hypothetical protein